MRLIGDLQQAQNSNAHRVLFSLPRTQNTAAPAPANQNTGRETSPARLIWWGTVSSLPGEQEYYKYCHLKKTECRVSWYKCHPWQTVTLFTLNIPCAHFICYIFEGMCFSESLTHPEQPVWTPKTWGGLCRRRQQTRLRQSAAWVSWYWRAEIPTWDSCCLKHHVWWVYVDFNPFSF